MYLVLEWCLIKIKKMKKKEDGRQDWIVMKIIKGRSILE